MNIPVVLTSLSQISARPDQLSSDLDGETILLHMTSGLYYGLNDVGAKIWSLIQTPQTLASLRETLLFEYEVTSDVCDRELNALLTDLSAAELIEIKN